MTLYDPGATPSLSREEFDYQSVTRPTGFGGYMGGKFSEGWERSGLGTFMRDPFGLDALEHGPRVAPGPGLGAAPRSERVGLLDDLKAFGLYEDQPRLTEQQWRDAGLAREGLKYEEGTLDYAKSRTEAFDQRRYRDSVIARYQGNVATYALGFAAQVAGGAASPENFIPFIGPGMRAAMVARLGVIGGHAATGAVDAMIGNALLDAYVLPDLARRGETITIQDVAMDIAMGAVAGTAFGGFGGFLERRRATANGVRSPGVGTVADALDSAHEAVHVGEPVAVGGYLRGSGILERLQRNGGALAGDTPDLHALRGETIGAAEFTAGHVGPDGALDLNKAAAALTGQVETALEGGATVTFHVDGKPVAITRVVNGMLTDAKGQRWGTATLATSTGPENSVRIDYGRPPEVGVHPVRAEGREVVRTLDEPLEGGGRHQRYEVTEGGRPAARALVGVHGDTAIVGAIGSADPSVPVAALGHRQLRELAAAVKRDNPGVQWIEGERVTGARKEPGKARVSIERLVGAERTPNVMTTAAPLPDHPRMAEAETPAPADFTAEQAQRIKADGLDAESYAADQALIEQARRHGDLKPGDEEVLAAGEAEASLHDAEALALESLRYCVGRFG